MTTVFFTSDHHFGHRAIMEYESRPFADTEQMNESMIAAWNEAVAPEDRVFHLGDFSFLNKEETSRILSRLNGYKTLILGNHDRGRSRSWWLEAGFQEVSENGIIFKEFFLLTHEPLYMNRHMPYVNVHGHIHGQKYEGNNHFNVCVEHWNYKPVSFETIMDVLTSREAQTGDRNSLSEN
ncbi:metallophosphoesterase [Paenibacillus apii]|uniref:metallophosphoesterase n=1 Tax=Paenibacillus apii TaxID=1850370 RepID=UPI00143ADE51|nr:metallophosphoesterase [Paenibacillus apii]NJJ37878.1 phosphoesterase [Paenibacillus apii]